jgi:hypothetical protein
VVPLEGGQSLHTIGRAFGNCLLAHHGGIVPAVRRRALLALTLTGAGAFRSTPEVLQEEISSRYSGQFVIGRDLDVY